MPFNNEIEKVKAEIKVLEKKLALLEEIEKQPKTLFDVIRNLGFSCDVCYEIVDAVEEFEKQKIKENLKTSLQEMVNGDVRPIDDVIKEAKKEPKKPQTLFDICFDWYNDYDGDHPIGDLVETIVRNWLPDPIPIDSDEYNSWNYGYNSYRQTLIHTLGGDDDPM